MLMKKLSCGFFGLQEFVGARTYDLKFLAHFFFRREGIVDDYRHEKKLVEVGFWIKLKCKGHLRLKSSNGNTLDAELGKFEVEQKGGF
jgi:hypothetical protein